ncbi:hypothetical protein DP73_20360 [Desulfosporosinus sp. HMP52]|uniref:hypothetical protein n=1 Tax=Desulfosporosinus sp. HMP52 TaxID=1487923 RepID=UPI00051F9392|nr:hypothetical protein [Desulfosporosinus sp. HMP52]KGK82711.1 hypothetical protein DP73_20360 [Desulfosporosinus sp. HMP52]
MLKNLKLLAAIYSYGIGCGLFSIQEFISWCEKVIEVQNNPPYHFIEMSLKSSESINDIENKLFEFYGDIEIDIQDVNNMLLGLVYKKWKSKQVSLKDAVRLTERLLIHTNHYNNQDYYNLSRLDDSYELAARGTYGNLDNVANEFGKAISEYESGYFHFIEFYRKVMNSEWIG